MFSIMGKMSVYFFKSVVFVYDVHLMYKTFSGYDFMFDNNKPFSIPFSFLSWPLTNTEFMVVNITPIVLFKLEKDLKIFLI